MKNESTSWYMISKAIIQTDKKNTIKLKQSNLDSALVLNNLKTFLTNVLALVLSLMSFGRLWNNLEAGSRKVPVSGDITSCNIAFEHRFLVV